MYFIAAAAIGLAAYGLLTSPLCPTSADILGGWHLLAVLPMIAGAILAAWCLRGVIERRKGPSVVLVGCAYAFLSALFFAAVFIFFERHIEGGLGFGRAIAESLAGCIAGPLYCASVAYFTLPLGMLGVLALRGVSSPAETVAKSA